MFHQFASITVRLSCRIYNLRFFSNLRLLLLLLLGIDPFLGGYDSKDAMSTAGFANITSSDWAAGILHNMHAFGCRFRLHWGDSVAMSRHFANQSIDCIFIDGDHTYNGKRYCLLEHSIFSYS